MNKSTEVSREIEIVKQEIEIFKLEYPDYTDETINDYLECCDDYSDFQKALFCRALGY